MLIFIDEVPEASFPIRDAFSRLRINTLTLRPKDLGEIPCYSAQALLIPRPEALSDVDGVCDLLRCRYPHLPIGILFREGHGNYYHLRSLCDMLFVKDEIRPREIVLRLFALYEERTHHTTKRYLTADVRTELFTRYLVVHCSPIIVSRAQWLIMRYLQISHPRPVPAEVLHAVCFSYRHPPGLNNVSAQISRFNTLILDYFGHAPIGYLPGKGYFIQKNY